ncbi:MAG: glycosyltransferase family 4 protein [Gomphosphaeria aponina SAG 52.96 = DSM 107014]|uniref:Glycosyltransferase family 4 protein n=1 Tax=Gomphosphaeria aponina SAG 52.96 = DSM 107014 TaxID=1521640 RepID=A0A941GP73_9CHRO|nr:glycosyltransferase family 4 protein [Gomphosphaeria aponina SAG 52.96 = DSM 107014]
MSNHSLKVLQLNQSDIKGGAAIAGYRLHQGLLKQGIDSKLLVGIVATDDERVEAVKRKYRLENQLYRFTWRSGFNYINLVSSFDIPQHPFYQEADILNFHNLHTGYFNYLAIPQLTKEKPAVYTLHDMWSFTGHCAYSYDCEKWQTGCGKCPYPQEYPAINRDTTALEWKLKNWVYNRSNITVVSPSQWLRNQATKSMLNQFTIKTIPHGIDTNAYLPLDQEKCRYLLGIENQKKVLMFGAESLKDKRKGGDLLLSALQKLPPSLKQEITLLTIGSGGEAIARLVDIPHVDLGYVGCDRLKSVAFSAADLLIFPTRADNLPLVLQESMACGTPMVSFNIGGVPDLVRPNVTGYLANPEDAEDFAQGIMQLLEDDQLRETMAKNCREIALKEYPLELQAQRYMALYEEILAR